MKVFRRCAWALITIVGVLLLVRTFFIRVYYVDSPSMEPTLHGAAEGGDHALVLFGDGSGIARGDVVVILPEGHDEPMVKRVLGLPGEKIALRDGDVWIDGKILRTSEVLPVPIPIFEHGSHDFATDFRVPANWSKTAIGWQVDASAIAPADLSACSFMRLGLKDHYLAPDGTRVPGSDYVGDGMLECHVKFVTEGFVARLGLVEGGDRFEIHLRRTGDSLASATLLRNGQTVKEGQMPWNEGTHELRFSNVNNRLTFEGDGEILLQEDYEENLPLGPMDPKAGTSKDSDRVYLGGHGGVGGISGIRVLRDLHYTPLGEHGVLDSVPLGPGEIFLLGDNSRESRDGREWGPTPLSAVIGRPTSVLWPPRRLRSLLLKKFGI